MDFEQLRLIDLLDKFGAEIDIISSARSLKRFNRAGAELQNVYNFLLSSQNAYEKQQQEFKNLFSSFNYAAVIINDAKTNGKLKEEDVKLLNECIDIMQALVQKLKNSLKN
ncbi:MAG: hypothetical protein K2N30_02930 [Clostridia bacterium]|nr:hypothetical protein [Clostridia bacterium]